MSSLAPHPVVGIVLFCFNRRDASTLLEDGGSSVSMCAEAIAQCISPRNMVGPFVNRLRTRLSCLEGQGGIEESLPVQTEALLLRVRTRLLSQIGTGLTGSV